MLVLTLISPFSEAETLLTLTGEDEARIIGLLVSRLLLADFEVLAESPDGEMIPWEELEESNDGETT